MAGFIDVHAHFLTGSYMQHEVRQHGPGHGIRSDGTALRGPAGPCQPVRAMAR
jgi:hypothetical protein